MIIKATGADTPSKTLYINSDKISYFYRSSCKDCTRIIVGDNNLNFVDVIESPEEILKLIEGVKQTSDIYKIKLANKDHNQIESVIKNEYFIKLMDRHLLPVLFELQNPYSSRIEPSNISGFVYNINLDEDIITLKIVPTEYGNALHHMIDLGAKLRAYILMDRCIVVG